MKGSKSLMIMNINLQMVKNAFLNMLINVYNDCFKLLLGAYKHLYVYMII